MAGEARRASTPPPPAELSSGWSFSASARRLDPMAVRGETALGPEPDRHRDAWAAYDEIPEVGTLVSSSASLLSQCRLYVGTIDEQQEERRLRDEKGAPIDGFDEQFVADAEACLARYVDAGGSQRALLLAQAENYAVTGDAYLIGWPIDEDGQPFDGEESQAVGERWEVVSRGAISKAQGRWTIQLAGERAQKLPEAAVCYRMWRKHPRRPDDTRAWVLQALEACRDLRIFTLAQRSAARSSIPAKILVVAQEASPKDLTVRGGPVGGQVPSSATGGVLLPGFAQAALGAGPAQAGPGSPPKAPLTWAQTLERLIGDAVMEVLRDSQSGRAVIPAVLAVAKDYVDKFHDIDLGREIDGALAGLVEQARTRVAEAADCPPEMLKGLGETNRWNGAQIADDEYRRYFRPTAMSIADAWTTELLWGGMRALGYKEADIRRARILVDARGVVAEPDKSKLATEGLRLGAIGWAAWRSACGFSEDDAPTPEEQTLLLEAFGTASRPQDGQAGAVNKRAGSAAPIETTAEEPSPAAAELEPREPVEPRTPTLGKLRSRTAASNAQEALSVEELAQQLTTIEASARSRLEEACEAALEGALSRGGAKLKTWARRDHDMRGLLAGIEPRQVAATLGPERARRIAATEFADDEDRRREDLFAAALVALLLSFGRIAESAYDRALRLLGVAILQPGEELPSWAHDSIPAAEIQANIDAGSNVLRASMLLLADREIFDPVTAPALGELSSFRVPAPVIRRAMAAAGGASIEPGVGPLEDAAPGLVFGPTLAPLQPDRTGWKWAYGAELRLRPYEPHLGLDGETFTGPTDPALAGIAPGGGQGFPGDHDGCKCDWSVVFVKGTAEAAA